MADRVVQAALKLVLEPIFEADFVPVSYGFRPMRRAQDAIAEIHQYGTQGYRWVLDADIEACFDSIDHVTLMDRVRHRVKDKRVLDLVKAFLKAGVLTEVGDREDTHTGTPQGGILSPPLANIAPYARWFSWPPAGRCAGQDRRSRQGAGHSVAVPRGHPLRTATDRLVRSHRGRDGGYELARPAADISIADVLRCIDSPLASVRDIGLGDLPYSGPTAALTDDFERLVHRPRGLGRIFPAAATTRRLRHPVDWTHGTTGPVVEGSAAELVSVLGNRPRMLSGLTGDDDDVLASRASSHSTRRVG